MYAGMRELCDELREDTATRVLVLRGAGGKAFAAGNEISDFLDRDVVAYEESIRQLLVALFELPQVTIAAVDGACVGDALKITILDFSPSGWGWSAITTYYGILTDQFLDPHLKIWNYDPSCRKPAMLSDVARVPLKPFPGTIGVLFALLTGWIGANEKDEAMKPFVAGVKRGTETLQAATMWLAANGMKNPNDAGAGATDYLRMMGITMLALMWSMMAKASLGKDDRLHRDKLMCARYWMERMVPECPMLLERIQAGSATVMELE